MPDFILNMKFYNSCYKSGTISRSELSAYRAKEVYRYELVIWSDGLANETYLNMGESV